MEEDDDHGGSQITVIWLKELSDCGHELFLSDRPIGSHLPSGLNIQRHRPFMFCSGQRMMVAMECSPLLHINLYCSHESSVNSCCWTLTKRRALYSVLFIHTFTHSFLFIHSFILSFSHSTIIYWVPTLCQTLFYFFFILYNTLGCRDMFFSSLNSIGSRLREVK